MTRRYFMILNYSDYQSIRELGEIITLSIKAVTQD